MFMFGCGVERQCKTMLLVGVSKELLPLMKPLHRVWRWESWTC